MKSFIALSLLSGALALPAPEAAPKSIAFGAHNGNLLTRANGEANVAAILAHLNYTLSKYKARPLPNYAPVAALQAEMAASNLAKRQVNEPLVDQYELKTEDVGYYGAVTIGSTNPQNFNLLFDTGSADVWVPGPSCTKAKGCIHTTKYSQGGTNLGTKTSIQYGSGATEGNNYADKFTIAGISATNQTLISVTTATGFTTIDADGLAGMAFSSIAQDNGTTFFENLVAEKAVTTPEFGFYLGRAKSGTQNSSVLTLGGRDSSKYTGSFTTVPVSSQTYWQVDLDGVTVGGASVAGTAGQAAIDTGTTAIVAPLAATKAVFKSITGSFGITLEGMEVFIVPCATTKIPAITFAGKNFPINSLDFFLGSLAESDVDNLALGDVNIAADIRNHMSTLAGGICISGFIGGNVTGTATPLYIVGDTFLKNWYSVFSYTGNNGSPAVLFAPNIDQTA